MQFFESYTNSGEPKDIIEMYALFFNFYRIFIIQTLPFYKSILGVDVSASVLQLMGLFLEFKDPALLNWSFNQYKVQDPYNLILTALTTLNETYKLGINPKFISRGPLKQGIMTKVYGSKLTPSLKRYQNRLEQTLGRPLTLAERGDVFLILTLIEENILTETRRLKIRQICANRDISYDLIEKNTGLVSRIFFKKQHIFKNLSQYSYKNELGLVRINSTIVSLLYHNSPTRVKIRINSTIIRIGFGSFKLEEQLNQYLQLNFKLTSPLSNLLPILPLSLETQLKFMGGFRANLIHSVDGEVVSQLHARCSFLLFTNHDAFFLQCGNLNQFLYEYQQVLETLVIEVGGQSFSNKILIKDNLFFK